jgi:two-component system response regulator
VKPILLIEDSAGDILLIKQVLSQASFATTLRVAMDGEQALEVLADPAFKPALIILDLNIPKVPGLQLLEQSHPTAPVVVFTSSANPNEIQRAMELGVREFVQKPNEFNEFARVVTKMIHDWSDPGGSGTATRFS